MREAYCFFNLLAFISNSFIKFFFKRIKQFPQSYFADDFIHLYEYIHTFHSKVVKFYWEKFYLFFQLLSVYQ